MKKYLGIAIAVMLIFALAIPAMADVNNNASSDATSGALAAGGDLAADGGTINKAYTDNTVIEDSPNKRNLPGAVGGPIPNMIAPLHDGGATANLQDVRQILLVRKVYTIKQLAVLESAARMDITVRAYQSEMETLNHPKTGVKGLDPDGKITIVLAFPNPKTGEPTFPEFTKDIAHITAKAGNTDCDTVALMAAAAIEAYRHGSTTLVITGQGAKKLLEAGGWAIMLGSMGTTINDNTGNASGMAMAAGIGYGEVESGYGYEPWFQAYGVK